MLVVVMVTESFPAAGRQAPPIGPVEPDPQPALSVEKARPRERLTSAASAADLEAPQVGEAAARRPARAAALDPVLAVLTLSVVFASSRRTTALTASPGRIEAAPRAGRPPRRFADLRRLESAPTPRWSAPPRAELSRRQRGLWIWLDGADRERLVGLLRKRFGHHDPRRSRPTRWNSLSPTRSGGFSSSWPMRWRAAASPPRRCFFSCSNRCSRCRSWPPGDGVLSAR